MNLATALATARRRANLHDEERYIITEHGEFDVLAEHDMENAYYQGARVIYVVLPDGEVMS